VPPLLAIAGLDTTLREQPLVALPLLFGAGLATSLTPCVYPMIPITAGVLGGAGAVTRSRGRTAAMTLAYVAGLALVYSLLGLLAGLTGTLFGTVSSSPWAYFVMANLLLLFGLALLDVVPVTAPRRLVERAARLTGDSVGAVFAMGAASGLVAAPCGAPAFGTVLTFVGLTGSAVLGFVYLFVFSLGMTTLLVAIGLASGRLTRLPRAGAWMGVVKKVFALVMLGVAEYYLIKMGQILI